MDNRSWETKALRPHKHKIGSVVQMYSAHGHSYSTAGRFDLFSPHFDHVLAAR